MDQTVISNIKQKYKIKFHRRLLLQNESMPFDKSLKSINLLDSLQMLVLSWDEITATNIKHSWKEICCVEEFLDEAFLDEEFLDEAFLDEDNEEISPTETLTLDDVFSRHFSSAEELPVADGQERDARRQLFYSAPSHEPGEGCDFEMSEWNEPQQTSPQKILKGINDELVQLDKKSPMYM